MDSNGHNSFESTLGQGADLALPVGERVSDKASALPRQQLYQGKYIALTPLDADRDAGDLFRISHADPERRRLWTYMPMSGPFLSVGAMRQWLQQCQEHQDYLFFSVRDAISDRAIGMTSFTALVTAMRRLELAFIWYGPEYHKTRINTEAIYLMLCEAFDYCGNRRVEWKCDALNRASRRAAGRLGFGFEGIFRQHMIVNGRNRDTAWFAMLDKQWPKIKLNMQLWLYENHDNLSLTEMNKPLLKATFPLSHDN